VNIVGGEKEARRAEAGSDEGSGRERSESEKDKAVAAAAGWVGDLVVW
jgi:hypothetical protein